MANDVITEKKERTLVEFLLIITLLFSLMASFVYYFFGEQQEFTKAAFERLANTFTERVVLIRSQWLMEERPVSLLLKTVNQVQTDVTVTINKKGWLDSNNSNPCLAIWLMATEVELNALNEPIATLEVSLSTDIGRICRYRLPSGEYFDYNSNNGSISAIKAP